MTTACVPLPSFGGVTNYSAANALALAVGDVNGDGIKDVVVVSRTMSSGDVTIYQGLGGTFGVSRPLRSGTATLATGVLIADVDGDGSNDVVTWDGRAPVATASSFSVSVHRQDINTPGTFHPVQTFAVPVLDGVVSGNLNGDNRADLVIQSDSPVETYPYVASSSTAGSFTKGSLIASNMTLSHVLDVDEDGLDDAVFTRAAGGLATFFNAHTTTAGTFTPVAVGAGSAANASFGRYESASRMDVVMWGSASATPDVGTLYAQTSPRVFVQRSTTVRMTPFSVNEPGHGLPTADINGDTRHDVVGIGKAVLRCPTAGTFWPSSTDFEQLTFGKTAPGETQVLVDINGNGKPDLIALDDMPGGIAGNFMEVRLQ